MARAKIPELYIRHSPVYDHYLHQLAGKKYSSATSKKLISYAAKLNEIWHKHYNNKIFKLISQVSGLRWKRTELDAWVVQEVIPFSHPMTLEYREDISKQVETIIHELCHIILIQNFDKAKKAEKEILSKFKKENSIVRAHLLVYSIEIPVLEKLFNKAEVNRLLERTKSFWRGESYWRSVQLVIKYTPTYFLKMLK